MNSITFQYHTIPQPLKIVDIHFDWGHDIHSVQSQYNGGWYPDCIHFQGISSLGIELVDL